jgi:hypothetical protein
MPHPRNHVTPLGVIEAIDLQAAWTGNRGILHEGQHIVHSHVGNRWITCDPDYVAPAKQPPRKYTALFFHDEAVSFAGGHRPCWKCRPTPYKAFRDAWSERVGPASADQIDKQLHVERFRRGTSRQVVHRRPWAELPDGAFVLFNSAPFLVLGDKLVAWTRGGYGQRNARPTRRDVDVITPTSTIDVLLADYPVQIDAAVRG